MGGKLPAGGKLPPVEPVPVPVEPVPGVPKPVEPAPVVPTPAEPIPTPGNIKRIPPSLMKKMGGEKTAAQIKKGIPGNPDLYHDPKTGKIYYPKPGGGFEDTGFNTCDFPDD